MNKLFFRVWNELNRIKEQLNLFADRTSAATMRANQLRLWFSAVAYLLLHGLRQWALKDTERIAFGLGWLLRETTGAAQPPARGGR